MRKYLLISAPLALGILTGCLSTENDSSNSATSQESSGSQKLEYVLDSVRTEYKSDSLQLKFNWKWKDTIGLKAKSNGDNGGWDDFPNKAINFSTIVLRGLSQASHRLPVPTGTRYPADAQVDAGVTRQVGCSGTRSILTYSHGGRFIIDSFGLLDSNAISHCPWQSETPPVEEHNRYTYDGNGGEAWEFLTDSVTDQEDSPRHKVHGTGRIKLPGGLELTIVSYDVVLLTPPEAGNSYVLDAKLILAFQEEYQISLVLNRPRPYAAPDFFPLNADADTAAMIMGGPITRKTDLGIDTLGFANLLSNRTLLIYNRAGLLF